MGTVYLIEYKNHFEVLRSLGELFLDLGLNVIVITTEKCSKILSDLTDENKLKLLDLKDSASINFDTKKDICIYITPFDITHVQNIPIKVENAYLLIHNLNYWLNPHRNFSLFKPPLSIKSLNLFKYWKFKSRKINNQFLMKFKGLLAPSGLRIDPYLSSKIKGTLDISYCRLSYTSLEKNDTVIRVVTPGTVNTDRDYLMAIKALAKGSNKHHQKIKYTLLGQNHSLAYDLIKNYINQDFEIELSEKEVPPETFTSIMANAHFCIIPLKREKNYKGVNEIRGETNISGGFNDVLRYVTPTILPAFYPVPESINSLFSTYENQDELELLIERWITDKKYLDIKHQSFNAVKNHMAQVLETQKKEFSQLLDD
jgi:hypothetical protein